MCTRRNNPHFITPRLPSCGQALTLTTLHTSSHLLLSCTQAAASAALRALGRHVRIAGLIQSEIALQHWMGHNVQLLEAEGEWPPPTPGWFLNVDWWSPDAGHDGPGSP